MSLQKDIMFNDSKRILQTMYCGMQHSVYRRCLQNDL